MWLTIQDIAAHRWSKRYAVASALLAPLLLAAISCPSSPAVLVSAAVAGTVLAGAAARATASTAPPETRCGGLPAPGLPPQPLSAHLRQLLGARRRRLVAAIRLGTLDLPPPARQ